MAEPWQAECAENVKKLGGTLCDPGVCADVRNYLHQICSCEPPYLNGCSPTPTPGCCGYSAASPIYVAGPSCFCCCGDASSGAWNAVSAGEHRPLAAFVEGDTVYVADDGSLKKWSERPVAFKGAAPAAHGVLVRIRFHRGGGDESVVVHRDQPFLLASHALRRAGELVPGVDWLVERDGSPVAVMGVDGDAGEGEVHHLATTRAPATSVDGHLVLVNGVVAGDYALQLADIDAINARGLAAV